MTEKTSRNNRKRVIKTRKNRYEIWDPTNSAPIMNQFYSFPKPIFVKSLPTTEAERERIRKKGKRPLVMRHFREAKYAGKRNGNHLMVAKEIRLDGKRPVECWFELLDPTVQII
jgi:hypothetical protein